MSSRRILILAVGIAIVGVVAVRWSGLFPQKSGMEGSIGMAKRYQAEQVSPADVQLTDADLQEFIQSDVFHQLATDASFRDAVTSDGFRKAVANGDLELARKQLGDETLAKLSAPETYKAVTTVLERSSSAEGALERLKQAPEVAERFTPDELARVSRSGDVLKRFNTPEMSRALDVINALSAHSRNVGDFSKSAGKDAVSKSGTVGEAAARYGSSQALDKTVQDVAQLEKKNAGSALEKTSQGSALEKATQAAAETGKAGRKVDFGKLVNGVSKLGTLPADQLDRTLKDAGGSFDRKATR